MIRKVSGSSCRKMVHIIRGDLRVVNLESQENQRKLDLKTEKAGRAGVLIQKSPRCRTSLASTRGRVYPVQPEKEKKGKKQRPQIRKGRRGSGGSQAETGAKRKGKLQKGGPSTETSEIKADPSAEKQRKKILGHLGTAAPGRKNGLYLNRRDRN